ncbi:MAG: serpin family protein, partial [Bryobacteraceae bacterium]
MTGARIALFAVATLLSAQNTPSKASPVSGFAVDSYEALAAPNRNLIFSPLSIAAVLSMALEGARGTTAAQMTKVLHQTDSPASLIEQVTNAANSGGDVLLNANGLWVQRGFSVKPEFKQTIQNVYRAPLTLLDFIKAPDQARAEINAWTDEHTEGKIHEMFGPGSLGPNARLVLTSAIYFNGKWQSAFRPQETHTAPFKLDAGGTVQASFMNQRTMSSYAETSSLQILEMKYGDGSLAFDILLPKPGSGLADMERSLTQETLTAWLAEVKPRTVEIMIPKFRTDAQFSLRETLSRMGMPAAFDAAAADFSGIDGRRDLVISDVVHKAFVDVSEEGTEAAAATGASISLTAMSPTGRTVFRADHPFAFLIRDTRT